MNHINSQVSVSSPENEDFEMKGNPQMDVCSTPSSSLSSPSSSWTTFERLQKNDPTFRKLKLIQPLTVLHYGVGTYEQFLSALRDNAYVEHIVLDIDRFFHGRNVRNDPSFRSIKRNDLIALLNAAGTLPNLSELEVWNDHRLSLKTLCAGVQHLQRLTKLGLGFVKIYDWDGCYDVFRAHASLKTVYLSHFQFIDDDEEDEVANTADNTEVDEEDDTVVDDDDDDDMGNDDTSMTDNDDDNHGNEDVNTRPYLDSFLHALSTCTSLEKVELHKCVAPDNIVPWTLSGGITYLAQNCSSLKTLQCRMVYLQTKNMIEFVRKLDENRIASSSSALQTLDLAENQLSDDRAHEFFYRIGSYHRIKTLILRDNQFTALGCQHLALARQCLLAHAVRNECTKLNRIMDAALNIDLTSTTIREEIYKLQNQVVLNQEVPICLEKLNLSGNPIGDEGASVIAQLLLKNNDKKNTLENYYKRLKHLELNRCKLTDDGCIRIAETLSRNKTLQSLSMFANTMTDVSFVALSKHLKENDTLTFLDINNGRRLRPNPTAVFELNRESRHLITKVGCEAILDLVIHNYTLTFISAGLVGDEEKERYNAYIKSFLALNHHGRKSLLQGHNTEDQQGSNENAVSSDTDWINMLLKIHTDEYSDFRAIHYIIRTNPTIVNHMKRKEGCDQPLDCINAVVCCGRSSNDVGWRGTVEI